ncbi:MAG: hypothetical protein E7300_04260 [Lachnospiraceae bacterium]|nr:hypothetical protein [Lachnospiraceae bacterium]
MGVVKAESGKQIFVAGQPIKEFCVIASGSVKVAFDGGEFLLGKGDILGIQDIHTGVHSCTYTAMKETSLLPYPFQGQKQLFTLLQQKPDVAHLFFTASIHFLNLCTRYASHMHTLCQNTYLYCTRSYEDYRSLCSRFLTSPKSLPDIDTLEALTLDHPLEEWLSGYYDGLRELDKDAKAALYAKPLLFRGFLFNAGRDAERMFAAIDNMRGYLTDTSPLLLNENQLDFLDLFSHLLSKAKKEEDIEEAKNRIESLLAQIEKHPVIDKELFAARKKQYEETLQRILTNAQNNTSEALDLSALQDSLQTILEFSGVEETIATRFENEVSAYKSLADKDNSDDSTRSLRLSLTKDFYAVFRGCFINAVEADDIMPLPVKLFLNFGFVDSGLCGNENAAYLLEIADSFKGDPENGVYTIYEWLSAILNGEKEPSRNEFDLDYPAYLHEQRTSGNITKAEEAELMNSPGDKVIFEMENVFPLVNKITFGRITTFCPLLSEHNILKDLPDILMTPEKVRQTLDAIRECDYTAFYRETVFSDEEHGITREFVQVEVRPDVILMPNIGARGAMWQEIEGKKRTTPARMMMSILLLEDPLQIMTRMVGEFRWEMCKRIQGAHWNDLSELSLTSEYTDYIQFYRKNRELSQEAKEKIQMALQKSKNSYKEMFVRDYITWMNYEVKGSPHLNKVSRGIIFTYCPFPAQIREQHKVHPLYKDLIEKHVLKANQKMHHMEMVCSRLQKEEADIPEPIQNHMAFLTM